MLADAPPMDRKWKGKLQLMHDAGLTRHIAIWAALAVGVVGTAVSIGLSVDSANKQEAAMEKQGKGMEKQARFQKQANYRTAVQTMQAAAQGITQTQYERHTAELERQQTEGFASKAFKKKHTPYQVATNEAPQGKAKKVFEDLRTGNNLGKPVSKGDWPKSA